MKTAGQIAIQLRNIAETIEDMEDNLVEAQINIAPLEQMADDIGEAVDDLQEEIEESLVEDDDEETADEAASKGDDEEDEEE